MITMQKKLQSQPFPTQAVLRLLIFLIISNILSGCTGAAQAVQHTASASSTSTPTSSALDQPAATAQPTSTDLSRQTVWLDPLLPAAITGELNLPAGWTQVEEAKAGLTVTFGSGHLISQWVLALTAPFPTLLDDVRATSVQDFWQGMPDEILDGRSLLMSESVFHALSLAWGNPANRSVKVIDEDALLQAAWDNSTLAIVPFEALEPRWKVITIAKQSPIQNDFVPDSYPLIVPISVQGEQAEIDKLLKEAEAGGINILPISNRDPSRMTVLAMTGVTALVRATAYMMERQGVTYPGRAIHKILVSADITHISNEAAFAENCPPPKQYDTSMVFCSHPEYIELLGYVGTDLVELTGDHLSDWGEKATYLTMQMYRDLNLPIYGGGESLKEASQPVFFEHNGNRLAFIGCNAKGAAFATATDIKPGAMPCDFDEMSSEVKRLTDLGYLTIVSIQHNEYEVYEAQELQIRDFHNMAESGAVIVSGSQSHRPQGLEFYEDTFLHYGLGNLFFDQYLVGEPNRQGFIDRHVFYNNRHISTELLATRLVDFAQPNLMTPDQREELLITIFTASGWQPIP